MKKKMKGETKTVPSVTLYKSDLEDILQAFSRNTAQFQITDDEFEYDNIEELESKRGQKITQLTIASNTLELDFMIGKNGNTFLTRGASTESIVPFTQIEQIVNRRRRQLMSVFFSYGFLISFALASVSLFVLTKRIWTVPLLVINVPLAIATGAQNRGAFSRIFLTNPHDEKSFWVRNKDTVLVGVIVAIVTAFITWLITNLTSK